METLAEVMKERVKTIDNGKELICETMRVLEETCDRVHTKRTSMEKKKGVYCCTDEIANKRNECLRKRRELMRCQKKSRQAKKSIEKVIR